MSKYQSTLIPLGTGNTNKEVEVTFEMGRGTETITIRDELLTSYDVAKARAESIFLEQSYITQMVTIRTFHIDGIELGDTATVDGIKYKIVSITETMEWAKIPMTISMKRWA